YPPGAKSGTSVAGNGQLLNGFNAAIGFYVDACDTLYIGATRGVIKFPPGSNGTGIPVLQVGYTGGITVGTDGSIYAALRGDNLVQKYALDSSSSIVTSVCYNTSGPNSLLLYFPLNYNTNGQGIAVPVSLLVGTLTYTNGIIDGAGIFDGKSALSILDSLLLRPKQFTICAFIKPTVANQNGRILEKGSSNSFWLRLTNGKGEVGYSVAAAGSDRYYNEAFSSSTIPINVWTCLCGVFDGQTLKIYVNGVLSGSKDTKSGTVPDFSIQPVVIGGLYSGNGYFTGSIEQVRLYSLALCASALPCSTSQQSSTAAPREIFKVERYDVGANAATGGVVVAGGHGPGTAQNQLNQPRGIFVDCSNNIYIADSVHSRSTTTSALHCPSIRWAPGATVGCTVAGNANGQAGKGLSQLNYPIEVQVDKQGNLFVLDQGNYRVLKFTPGSSVGVSVAGNGNKANGFDTAIGFYVDSCDTVYIGAAKGVIKFPAGSNGTGIPVLQVGFTGGITTDKSGNLYVGSRGGNAVRKYTLIKASAQTTVQPVTTKTNNFDIVFCVDGISGDVTIEKRDVSQRYSRASTLINPNSDANKNLISNQSDCAKSTCQITYDHKIQNSIGNTTNVSLSLVDTNNKPVVVPATFVSVTNITPVSSTPITSTPVVIPVVKKCGAAQCGSFVPCSSNSKCSCFALYNSTGGWCADGTHPCSELTQCGVNGLCPADSSCIVNSCCNIPVCYPSKYAGDNVCPLL
ncbi:unnamed protein product, partial [Didymodactylos carnosus]